MRKELSAEKKKEYRENYKRSGGVQREKARRKERLLLDKDFAEQEAQKRREYWRKNKDHFNKRAKEHKAKNPEMAAAWRHNSWRFNRATHLISSIRIKCREQGLEFDLTKSWLQQKIEAGKCELSGLPFDMDQKRGPMSPTVDRIDPKGGYTMKNCRLIIWYLNRALSNLGEDFAVEVFKKVIAKREAEIPFLSMVA